MISLIAWQGSTSSGGDKKDAASTIMIQIAENTQLTYLCRKIGEELVDAAIGRQIAQLRPTVDLLKKKEGRISQAWFDAQCPVGPLVSISYGATQFANADIRRRINHY